MAQQPTTGRGANPGGAKPAAPVPLTDDELQEIAADPGSFNLSKLTQEEHRRLETILTPSNAPEGSAVSRLAGGVLKNVNPLTALQGLYNALPIPEALGGAGVMAPVKTAGAMLGAQKDQLMQALEALRQGGVGNLSRAVGHGAAAAIPLIGPMAANAGERIGSGDVAGGVGETLGLLAPFGAGAAVRGATAATKAGIGAARTTATGVSTLDKLAEMADAASSKRIVEEIAPKVGPNKTRFGTAAKDIAPQLARDADLSALSRESLHVKVGQKLDAATAALDEASDARNAGKAFPTKPIIDSLEQKRAKLTAEPVIGSRMVPEYVQPDAATAGVSGASDGRAVSNGGAAGAVRGGSFNADVSEQALFRDVEHEARRLGFDGYTGELRSQFENKLALARDLQQELSDIHTEHGPQALFRAIAKYGGIGADAGNTGEIADLWENSTGIQVGKGIVKGGSRVKQSRTLSSGGMGGVPGVLKKTGGLSLDGMARSLSQDPQFKNITGPNDLLDAMKQARFSKAQAPSFQDALEVVGLQPGVRWWEGDMLPATLEEAKVALERRGRPIGRTVEPAPSAERIAAIDQVIKEVKQLGPVARYESLRRIRQSWDGPAKAVYHPSVTADFLKAQGGKLGAADATAALREHLAGMDPATAAANADFSLYKTAKDVLDATAEAERVRPKVGRKLVATAAGAMAGTEAAGIPGAIGGAMLGALVQRATELAPTMKIVVARKLAAVADLLRAGKTAEAQAAVADISKLMPTARAVVKRAAVPLGRVREGVSYPRAADNQEDTPPMLGQR